MMDMKKEIRQSCVFIGEYKYIWSINDIKKIIVKSKHQPILDNLINRPIILCATVDSIFKGINIHPYPCDNTKWQKFINKYINIKSIENIMHIDQPNYNLLYTYLYNLESKYNNKFNDLYENTSKIIKELKKDLDIKNGKIRDLELKVYFIESQIDKKVKIDYNYIKEKNKNLNNEFKRVAKLMKLI